MLRWKNDKPVLAEKVWDTLSGANTEIFECLEEMNNQYRVMFHFSFIIGFVVLLFYCDCLCSATPYSLTRTLCGLPSAELMSGMARAVIRSDFLFFLFLLFVHFFLM